MTAPADLDRARARLAAMRERLDAATPGPWTGGHRCVLFNAYDGEGRAYGFSVSGEYLPVAGFLPVDGAPGEDVTSRTAAFIAAARTDMELALACAEALASLAACADGPPWWQEANESWVGCHWCGARVETIAEIGHPPACPVPAADAALAALGEGGAA